MMKANINHNQFSPISESAAKISYLNIIMWHYYYIIFGADKKPTKEYHMHIHSKQRTY